MRTRFGFLLLSIVIVSLGIQACSRPLDPEAACGFVQNPEQQRVSWTRNVPIKLYLHKSVPTEAYASIDKAITQFHSTLGREVFRVVARGVDKPSNPGKDGYSIIYWFKTWESERPNEQARTTIYWTGTEIFEADIRVNAANFSYYMGENTSFAGVDLVSLLTHEFGHVLGLSHNVTSGSVMNFSLNEGQERRKLGDTDTANLKCEY